MERDFSRQSVHIFSVAVQCATHRVFTVIQGKENMVYFGKVTLTVNMSMVSVCTKPPNLR